MATSDQGITTPNDGLSAPVPRRRFVEVLLGGGFLATAAAFAYPVCATWSHRKPPTSEAILSWLGVSES